MSPLDKAKRFVVIAQLLFKKLAILLEKKTPSKCVIIKRKIHDPEKVIKFFKWLP